MTRPLVLMNESLRVEIALRGAELQRIQTMQDDVDYLWSGDPDFWGRRAPLLFPIVGKIKDNSYEHKGVSYTLNQHGFARDMDFELQSSDDTSAHYCLSATDQTKAHYPFEFDLYVHYKLVGATLHTTYELVNVFGEALPYALGTHPAFLLGDGHHAPSISSNELLPDTSSHLKDGLLLRELRKYDHSGTTVTLSGDTFKDDALIFRTYAPRELKLTRRDGRTVTITHDGFHHTALWSKVGAPFVCIEHWTGHADLVDAPQKLIEKPTMSTVKDGHIQFTTAMTFA